MRSNGSDEVDVTNTPDVESEPAWSPLPTNQRIAFVRGVVDDLGNDGRRIWTMRPDGSRARNLSRTSTRGDWNPAWSPDARHLAFTSRRPVFPDNGSPGLWLFNRTGSGPRALIAGGYETSAGSQAFSPDGTGLLLSTSGFGYEDLYTSPFELDGSLGALFEVTNNSSTAWYSWEADWQALRPGAARP
jgi:Tol biopolymer transport system component